MFRVVDRTNHQPALWRTPPRDRHHRLRRCRRPGLIRNRLKIASVRGNAHAALAAIDEFGSLDEYLWSFVGGKPIRNAWTSSTQVPASTDVSDRMSKALKKRGFRFVGTTICYAFMQATGMVDDHLTTCFRHGGSKMQAR